MENTLFNWDWRMVAHLYIGGLAVGLFAFAVLLFHLNGDRYRTLVCKLLPLGPIGVAIGLIFLLMGLKEGPGALVAFLQQNPGSDITIGLLLQIAFLLLGSWVLIRLKQRGYEQLPPPVLIVTALLALAVALFHGSLLLWADLPFWSEALLGVMLLSALAGGVAGGWLLARRPFGTLGPAPEDGYTVNVPLILVPMLAALGLLLFVWMQSLGGGELMAQLALLYLMEEQTFWLFGMVYGVGLFLPLALLTSQILKKQREPGRWVALIAALSVLISTLVLKSLIIHLGTGL